MQNSFSLNELYVRYTDGLLKKKELEGEIFKSIQENINRYGLVGWTKQDSDDYLSSLYLRISRAINTYQETGSSFETYINSMVRLTAKEYRSRQIRSYLEENAVWITQLPDMYVCENDVEYNDHAAETKPPEKFKNPRQLLILLLKCSNHVTSDFLERISPRLGIEPESLSTLINHLKRQREKREMEITLLREKINLQFYRCILLEKRLRLMAENSVGAQRLRKKLEQGRNRLIRIRKQIAYKRFDPSNAQIAKLLGISKGTVDSVLYNLRMQGAAQGAPYPVTDPEDSQ
jgi:DNA-directed RNA polymerase specialized sigma24 family protein